MKILYKTMGLGLLSACLCLLCAAPASAKVCFVGEENCTGGGSFEDYENPDADGSLCKQEGYTEKSLCQADMTKYIVAYCPYNSNYVMCCGREYSYDACVYPLVADGKCGNRFKCRCDSDKYPYKQQSATICQNTVTGQNYNNSLASGASCVYTGFANGQTSINAYFTECLCDRGIYPKTEEECLNNGSTTTGNSCTDSNGNTYYAACICGDKFKVISSDCKYGTYITDPLCTQGDVVKAPKCCDCNINTYPYEDMNNEEVETYASCESLEGCTRGSRYKATSCKLGYKIDGGKCVPKECDEILTDYIKDKGIKDYVLYETGKTPSATNVIIAKDTGYGAEWKNFYNKKVISAMVYANAIYGSDTLTKLVKQQCTETPEVYISGDMTSTSPLDFKSVFLRTSSSWWNKGGFTCTNCGVESFHLYNQSKAELKYDANLPNANNMYAKYTGGDITAEYRAKGYNHEFGSLGFVVTNPGNFIFMIEGKSSSDRVTLTGEKFSVKGLAAIKYANIKVSPVCVGTTCGYSDTSSGVYFNNGDVYRTSSTLSLYDTTYWLYENGLARSLHMATSSFVGNERGNGSIIVFSDVSYNTVSFAQLWSYCSDRPQGNYPYITSSGTISSRTLNCFYYGASVRDGEKHSKPDDARCKIDGNNNQYGYSQASNPGCKWRNGDSSDRTPYFQFNGDRGWSRN